MASLAGLWFAAPFDPVELEDVVDTALEYCEPDTETLVMLMALDGLAMLDPSADPGREMEKPPVAMLGVPDTQDGCWRMVKTKVLLIARLRHCG